MTSYGKKILLGQLVCVQKLKCLYNMCQRISRPGLIGVWKHLIQFGQHSEFWVCKGPSPKDDFDDEWATRACIGAIVEEVQVDEGVHMDYMVENLFQPEPMA